MAEQHPVTCTPEQQAVKEGLAAETEAWFSGYAAKISRQVVRGAIVVSGHHTVTVVIGTRNEIMDTYFAAPDDFPPERKRIADGQHYLPRPDDWPTLGRWTLNLRRRGVYE